jgi:YidC/Oxa1 family membrane protein insertase
MDFQRYLLIGAIAVLSYMLVVEWTHFQQQRADATESVTAAPAVPNTSIETSSTADVPANPAVPLATSSPDAQIESSTSAKSPALIHVRTDVLDLQIDPRGGDIVYAALPKFTAKLDKPGAFVLLQQEAGHTYIAQSGLIGVDSNSGRPLYRSESNDYTMAAEADSLTVSLSVETAQHIVVTKAFTFRRGDYLVDIAYHVENKSEAPWQGTLYGRLKRDDSKDPSAVSGGFGISSFLGAAINKTDPASTKNDGYHKLPFKDMAEKPLKIQQQGGWLAFVQHYFLSAWIPAADQQNNFETSTRDGTHFGWFTGAMQTIAPAGSADFSARFYAGPKDQYRLGKVSPGLELSVDYGWLTIIAQPLFYCLTKIHGLLHNWGWSIMVLTLGVKVLFFWLNAKAYMSMANMRRVQPKLVEIRERYADDKQKQSQEMMSLYKTEKINPLGGCLPMVVQMPVFLALYWVLLESVELRHAPWILWIKDLSAMDPYFVLPLIMGATMFIQQRLNPPPPDPMQAKVMQYMPIMFTVFFLWFPAGLVLYYIVNNVLSIGQQYIITKRIVKA